MANVSAKTVGRKPAGAARAQREPDEPLADKAEGNRRQKVQSATVGVLVLRALAELGGSASVTSLGARLGENPAKVHRYLASLIEADFVFQDKVSSRYVLGTQSIAIGLAALRQSDVLTWSAAELPALAERLRASCFVACIGSHGPTIVRWEEPAHPVVVNVRVGSVLPVLWSATGRAFGAFSDAPLVDGLIATEMAHASAAQKKLLPNREAVQKLFRQFRAHGCAWVNDVLLHGVSSVAAPVFDASGAVVSVITALGMSGDFDTEPDHAIATAVRNTAGNVSRRLGWADPVNASASKRS